MTFFKHHIFTILTLLLITALSLMPAQEFPQVDVQFADKWAHWLMYGFLSLVMGAELIIYRRHKWSSKQFVTRFLLIFLFSSIYGGVMELAQAFLTSTRHGDWMDFLANSFGAFCAYVILCGVACKLKN